MFSEYQRMMYICTKKDYKLNSKKNKNSTLLCYWFILSTHTHVCPSSSLLLSPLHCFLYFILFFPLFVVMATMATIATTLTSATVMVVRTAMMSDLKYLSMQTLQIHWPPQLSNPFYKLCKIFITRQNLSKFWTSIQGTPLRSSWVTYSKSKFSKSGVTLINAYTVDLDVQCTVV